MHSYNNGTSLTCKRDNWNQLLKFFSKRGIEPGGVAVTRAETEEIIHCRSEAIDRFINRSYEFLTGKKCVCSLLLSSAAPAHAAPAFAAGSLPRLSSAGARAPRPPLRARPRRASPS